MTTANHHLFYGLRADYHSAKVRAFFDAKQIAFEEVVPDQHEMEKVIKARTGKEFCPVVISPDNELWQNSVSILEALDDQLSQNADVDSIFPESSVHRFIALMFELYCDSLLYLPAMFMRWGYDEGALSANMRMHKIYNSHSYAKLQSCREQQKLMLLGLNRHNGPFYEYHAEQTMELLNGHFEHHEYVLGDQLSVADLALMGPIYGHFAQDKRPKELLIANLPYIQEWLARMLGEASPKSEKTPEKASAASAKIKVPSSKDRIPESLYALIQHMADDALPFWIENLKSWHNWASHDRMKAEAIPDYVATHRFVWNSASVEQPTSVDTVWQLQRLLEVYESADEEAREQLDNMADSLGFADLLSTKIEKPVVYLNYRFYHQETVEED